jgi:hypothetical protein
LKDVWAQDLLEVITRGASKVRAEHAMPSALEMRASRGVFGYLPSAGVRRGVTTTLKVIVLWMLGSERNGA